MGNNQTQYYYVNGATCRPGLVKLTLINAKFYKDKIGLSP